MMVYNLSMLIITVASYSGWTGVRDYTISFRSETLFRTLASPMVKRCLFTIETGFTGILSKFIRGNVEEDYVSLCERGALPLIVRPKGDDWEVVGNCYIHGRMKEEPYESVRKDMETMWFV